MGILIIIPGDFDEHWRNTDKECGFEEMAAGILGLVMDSRLYFKPKYELDASQYGKNCQKKKKKFHTEKFHTAVMSTNT